MNGQVGPDGYVRSAAEERRLNKSFAALFEDKLGEEVISYLRQITIEAVSGPDIAPEHLRHLEGMRYLTFIIQKRISLGKQDG